MKLPRDVMGTELAAALQRFGYRFVRQRGSHMHLVTNRYAEHHGMTRDELINTLEL